MQNEIYTEYFKTPFGELILGSLKDELCLCDWHYRKKRSTIDQRIKNGLNAEYIEKDSAIIKETKIQLAQYFDRKRITFDIPCLQVGSAFQKSVWKELMEIPYGRTETYQGLSRKLGDEKAIRAVAMANGTNAISIIVPCHRIIGTDGKLVGYAGGLQVKRKLLALENALIKNQYSLF